VINHNNTDPAHDIQLFKILFDSNVTERQEWIDKWDNILRIVRNVPSEHDLAIRFPWFFLLFRWLLALPLYILLFLFHLPQRIFSTLCLSLLHIIFTCDIHEYAIHIPTFYAPRSKKRVWLHFVVMAAFGIIFSGVHLAGWKLQTVATQATWRLFSVYMFVAILAGIPLAYCIARTQVYSPLLSGFLFTGVWSRVALVVLAFTLLRVEVDPTAFCALDWTKFIPHLGV